MADSVSVTSHKSYGSRVWNSFKNIFRWIVLVIISICLLAWNENNYVEQKKALEEWAKIVQEANINQIDSELEWKEVHVSWETASNAETLKDSTFWVKTDNLKLKRTVEMYQWYEEEHEECHDNYWWSEDCTTTYTYDTKWSKDAISSSKFYKSSGHENPSTWEFESNERVKEPITLWAYTLANVFVDQLTNYKIVNLSEQDVNTPEKYKWNEGFHINGDQIYIWVNPEKPAVWDLRITFSSVKPWTISIVWKQMGNGLDRYTTSNGRTIALLEEWNISAADMFLHAHQENRMMAWILRLVWLLLMFSGFSMMFKFIETLAKVLPFLANIIGVWTGIIALWLTLIVWFITIWIAWLVARPIIWICCLVVAACGLFLLIKSKKSKKEDNPEPKLQNSPEENIES